MVKRAGFARTALAPIFAKVQMGNIPLYRFVFMTELVSCFACSFSSELLRSQARRGLPFPTHPSVEGSLFQGMQPKGVVPRPLVCTHPKAISCPEGVKSAHHTQSHA